MVTKYFFYDKAIGADALLLSPHFNTGIARSLPIPLSLIVLITMFVIGALCFLYYKKQLLRRVFALLTAGAIGNMYDRVLLWWVRDFIDLGWFPVFNIADIAISLAALVIIASILFPWKFGIKE
jgi:signal peptidase II